MPAHAVLHGNHREARDVSGELGGLPLDILSHITSFQDRSDIRGFTSASTQLYRATNAAHLPFTFKGPPSAMAGYAERNPYGPPRVTWVLTDSESGEWTGGDLPMVSELVFRDNSKPDFLNIILQYLPNLRVLTVVGIDNSPYPQSTGILDSLQNLKTLNLISCINLMNLTNLVEGLPKLETLQLLREYEGMHVSFALNRDEDHADFLLAALPKLTMLRHLTANDVYWHNNPPLSISLPNLITLTLQSNSGLGLNSIFDLISGSSNLETMRCYLGELGGTDANIATVDDKEYTHLRAVTILVDEPHYDSLVGSLVAILRSMPNLENLDIGFNGTLDMDINNTIDDILHTGLLRVPNLKGLQLNYWDITGITLDRTSTIPPNLNLHTLVLIGCDETTLDGMTAVVNATPGITTFRHMAITYLSADQLGIILTGWKKMKDLHLTGFHISDALINTLETFVRTNSPFKLTKLYLQNARYFPGPYVDRIVLSEFLRVFAPNLTKLYLRDMDLPYTWPSLPSLRLVAIKQSMNSPRNLDSVIRTLFDSYPALDKLWIYTPTGLVDYDLKEVLDFYNKTQQRLAIDGTMPA